MDALAVLGVKSAGTSWRWRTPEDYPPILSKIIKVARFILIQQAMQQTEELDESSESEETSSSNPSEEERERREQGRQRPKEHCLELVTRWMDQFMIRGSHSAMQWMLDLRTYGLRIHYNTTAEGSID